MAKDKLAFGNIFEGNDIKPEMKEKITSLLNDVVDRKVEARLAEEKEKEEDDEEDDEEKEKPVEEAVDPDEEEPVEEGEDEEDKEEKEDEEEPVEEAEDKEDEEEPVEEAEDKEDEEEPVEEGEDKEDEEEPEEMVDEGLSDAQKKKRDEIVKAMMKGKEGMKKRYGSRWQEVMYATATTQAMEESAYDLDEDAATELVGKLGDIIQNVNVKRVGTADEKAFNKSMAKFKSAFVAAFRDLANNKMAAPAVEFLSNLMNVIATDSTLATRVASDIRKQEKAAAKAEMEEQVSQQIDKYLSYVAEQWAEENKLALENGIKVQLAESFLKKFDELYAQFNFKSVPERDMVVEMTQKVVEAENRLNEEVEKNATLLEKMNKQKKDNLINEATKGLTATQVEKFKKLVENVTFENASSFEQKLQTIKETAFTKEVLKSDTTLDEEATPQLPSNPRMDKYVDAISKNLKF
jgi:hypothetical protein